MFDGNIYGTGELTGDYLRRSLMFCLPYSVIAGYGIYILNPLKKKKYLSLSLVLCFLLIIFLNPLFKSEYPFVFKLRPLEKSYNFYFPRSLFKDARATKTGDRTLVHPGEEYWMAVDKIPNSCLVISSQYMLATNDYFKDNKYKVVAIDLINTETEELFLKEFKNNECLVFIRDYRCDSSYPDGKDYACQFLENHLVDKKIIFQSDYVNTYIVELIE